MITRRQVLGLLVTSLAAGAVSPSRALGSWPRREALAELDEWIAERLAQVDVKAIGAAWIAAHPGESSGEVLTQAIMKGRRRGESLGEYLARVVAEEHRAGRAEVLDGWYLAPTEARIAALSRLSSRPS